MANSSTLAKKLIFVLRSYHPNDTVVIKYLDLFSISFNMFSFKKELNC